MKMMRYFFVSDELDEVEQFESELEQNGIVKPQIHVLSHDDCAVAHHRDLHPVKSFMKKDVIHSTFLGAGIGAGLAAMALLITYLAEWNKTPAGWMPFVFLAIVILGFFTWQGGLWGVQSPNVRFRPVAAAMDQGAHVIFVDAPEEQQARIREIAGHHSHVRFAAVDTGAPSWMVFSQHRLIHFFTHIFP